MIQRTPLYQSHIELGAKMVEFAGWEMPVQYSGILAEHQAVRNACGIFDISHMGEFRFRGQQAAEFLDYLLTNRASDLVPGTAHYSLMLNEQGGVIDDLYVYRLAEADFLLIVNAARLVEDSQWVNQHLPAEVEFANQSADYAAFAVQGPSSPECMAKLIDFPLPQERNRVISTDWRSNQIMIATTGYTGETGFEIICPAEASRTLWHSLVENGATPCGLGARDILRLEMCYPLNGNDLSPDVTPLVAALKFFVNVAKGDFIGRSALEDQLASGLPKRLVALEMTSKSPPPRPHYPVLAGDKVVGETTSGGHSPSLGKGIALALVDPTSAKVGQDLEIQIRSRNYPATVVRKPFIKRRK